MVGMAVISYLQVDIILVRMDVVLEQDVCLVVHLPLVRFLSKRKRSPTYFGLSILLQKAQRKAKPVER